MKTNPQVGIVNVIIDLRDAFINRGIQPSDAMAFALSFMARLAAETQRVKNEASTSGLDIEALLKNSKSEGKADEGE